MHGRRGVIPAFQPRHPRQAYIEHVQACKEALYAGESYELCLTNALSRHMAPKPLQLYYALRRRSPAPYAAFLSFGASGPHVSLLLASAEQHRLGIEGSAWHAVLLGQAC